MTFIVKIEKVGEGFSVHNQEKTVEARFDSASPCGKMMGDKQVAYAKAKIAKQTMTLLGLVKHKGW